MHPGLVKSTWLDVGGGISRQIIRSSPQIIIAADLNRQIIEFNPAAELAFGYRREEMIGAHASVLYAHSRESADIYDDTLAMGGVLREITNRRKNGELFPALLTTRILVDVHGAPIGQIGIARELSEDKWRNERLRTTEDLFRTIVENSTDIVTILDRMGQIVYESPSVKQITGYRPEQLIGRSIFEHLHPDDLAMAAEKHLAIAEKIGSCATAEVRFRKSDGSYLIMEARARSILNEVGDVQIVVISRDITNQKRDEFKIRRSETLFRTLAETASAAIYIQTMDRLLYVNPAAESITGYTRRELRSMSPWAIVHPDYHKDFIERMEQVRDHKAVRFNYEFRIIAKDQSQKWISATSHQLMYDGHRAAIVVGIDITARREMEDALRASEVRCRSIFESAKIGMYRSDLQKGRFLSVNPALVKMLGYQSAEELLAVDLEAQVYADPADRKRLINQLLQEDSYEIPEVQFRTKQGKTRLVRVAGTCARDENGEFRFCEGVIEDVTEKKLLEAQLSQSQKMEAIGRLAGGVAHDFNNLLTVISGYSEVLLGLDVLPAQGQEALHEIVLASRRAAALTRQLLTFSRKQVVAPELTAIGEAIAEATRMLKRLLPADVRLLIDCQPDPIEVLIDPSQLQQLILNLALNARDALQGSGNIHLELRRSILSEPLPWFSGVLPPGAYAQITARDNGIGMSQETVENIFEPFFTTKDLGSGTGLGLATVYGIVRQSGGGITVESRPGQGTRFTVFLPLPTSVLVRRSAAIPPEHRVTPIGSETILLVEDEQIVRDFIAHAIRRLGYTVITADSGPAAIRSCQDHAGEIHVIVTDVILGEMSGPEVAAAIRDQRPDIAVLFMSGYNDDALLNRGIMMQEIAFLAKPFTTEQLARKLRDILAKAPSHKATTT